MNEESRKMKEEHDRVVREAQESGLKKFMTHPMTKLAVSMIPPTGVLTELLQTAYETGFMNGSHISVESLARSIMRKIEQEEEPKKTVFAVPPNLC